MVNDFYGNRYASCLAQLEKLQSSLALDVHLHSHAKDLSAAVRFPIPSNQNRRVLTQIQ